MRKSAILQSQKMTSVLFSIEINQELFLDKYGFSIVNSISFKRPKRTIQRESLSIILYFLFVCNNPFLFLPRRKKNCDTTKRVFSVKSYICPKWFLSPDPFCIFFSIPNVDKQKRMHNKTTNIEDKDKKAKRKKRKNIQVQHGMQLSMLVPRKLSYSYYVFLLSSLLLPLSSSNFGLSQIRKNIGRSEDFLKQVE